MNKILKNILTLLLIATPAVLLVVPDNMFFPFITGKGMLFRFLVEILAFTYIFAAWSDPSLRPKRSLLLISVSIFVAVALIADLLSPNFTKAFWSNFERMEGFVLIAHLFAYFIVLGSTLNSKKNWVTFFYSSLAVSIAMNLYGLLQVTGGTAINQSATRIDAVMGNSAYFAGFLMFQIFIMAFLARYDTNRTKNIFYSLLGGSSLFLLIYLSAEQSSKAGNLISGISMLSSLVLLWISNKQNEKLKSIIAYVAFSVVAISHIVFLFLTQTRGAALGFLGGVLLVSLLVAIFEKGRKLRFSAFAILGITIIFIGGFIAIKNTDFVQNNPILKRFADISWSNQKGQARQIIWPMAIEGVKEKPILGWGQEGFNYVFAKYYNPELWKHEPWFDRTHNVFLDWMVAAGVLGFLAYLSMYVAAILSVKKVFFAEDKTSFAILVGLVSAYAFQNMFIFDNLGSYILFFSLIAFLHNLSLVTKIETVKKNESELSPVLIGGLCAVGFFMACYGMVYKPYIQNTSLIKGMSPQKNIMDNLALFKKTFSLNEAGAVESREHFMSVLNQILGAEQVGQDVKQAFFTEAITQIKKQQTDGPLELKAMLSIASAFNQNGNPDVSLELLQKAREYSPKKQHILMQIGISYLIKGDIEGALEPLKTAYDLAPEYPEAAMLYVSALLNKGENETAYAILDGFAKEGIAPANYLISDFRRLKMNDKAIEFVSKAYAVSKDENQAALLEELKK